MNGMLVKIYFLNAAKGFADNILAGEAKVNRKSFIVVFIHPFYQQPTVVVLFLKSKVNYLVLRLFFAKIFKYYKKY